MSYMTRKIKAASERGKRMAKRRWQLDAERRERLVATDPIRFEGRIVRRIVVIDQEQAVREVTIYDWDSARDWRRKERKALRE